MTPLKINTFWYQASPIHPPSTSLISLPSMFLLSQEIDRGKHSFEKLETLLSTTSKTSPPTRTDSVILFSFLFSPLELLLCQFSTVPLLCLSQFLDTSWDARNTVTLEYLCGLAAQCCRYPCRFLQWFVRGITCFFFLCQMQKLWSGLQGWADYFIFRTARLFCNGNWRWAEKFIPCVVGRSEGMVGKRESLM